MSIQKEYISEYEKEADDRNSILIGKYNKIPSYALWRDIDIQRETLSQRRNWWNGYCNAQNKLFSNTVKYWLKYLTEKNNI